MRGGRTTRRVMIRARCDWRPATAATPGRRDRRTTEHDRDRVRLLDMTEYQLLQATVTEYQLSEMRKTEYQLLRRL